MAYDEDLADRLRALLSGVDGISEKRMFGGLAFLAEGRMSVSASRDGGLLVRLDPAVADPLLARPGIEPMVMRGRPLEGWLRVAPEAVGDLGAWVERSLAFVRTLPPK